MIEIISKYKKTILATLILLIGCYFFLFVFYKNILPAWFFILTPLMIIIIIPTVAIFALGNFVATKYGRSIEITGLILLTLFNTGIIILTWKATDDAYEYKKLEDYSHFNDSYTEWLKDMPESISKAKTKADWHKITWDNLDNKDKEWVKRFFDLIAQEYYYSQFKQQMIPKEMWDGIYGSETNCKGTIIITLCEYPILLEGFTYWNSNRSFMYPTDFRNILSKKLQHCNYPQELNCNEIR